MQTTFTNWYDNEPNNAGDEGEDCVETTNFNKWNALACDENRMFICIFDEKLNALTDNVYTTTATSTTRPETTSR